jgi:hypothetical protein
MNDPTTKNDSLLLAGCGILQKEVRFLNEKNGWGLDFAFLDSSLHCSLCKLADSLNGCLKVHKDRDLIVLYGACHPLMDQILHSAGTFRTEGQNCVEQLLGHDLFTKELVKGAFFLMEDWALRWDYIMKRSFPSCRPEILREIFHADRTRFLALRTPVSDDFTVQAEEVAAKMDLPLEWMDVSLDHLEQVLLDAINRKKQDRT